MQLHDQNLLKTCIQYWAAAYDCASSNDSEQSEMTSERYAKLSADPEAEMKGMIGGKGVIRNRLKREDAKKILRMRNQRPLTDDGHTDFDTNAVVLAANLQLDEMNNADGNVLEFVVNNLPVEDLQKISDALPVSGGDSARKILNIIPHMSKVYRDIEAGEDKLANLKMRYEQAVLDLFLENYVKYDAGNGEANYNLAPFKKMVVQKLERKMGAAENEAARAAASSSGCAVM